MTEQAYPAARAAAVRIHPHFARYVAAGAAPQPEEKLAPVPPIETVDALIDSAFWASLRREEGLTPRLSLAFVAPEQVKYPLRFERPLALASQPLTRVAPAVDRPGIHLGVFPDDSGELRVWGATRNLPYFCFVLEVIAPGVLVVKQSPGDESGKFINVAVIEGEEVKVIDQEAANVPDCPDLLASLLGFETRHNEDSINVLIQLAVSMRAHRRGGMLLVVPTGTEAWRESIVHPITYSVAPAFSGLADLMSADPGLRPQRRWQDALRRAIDAIAGFTAVDGATVITDTHELLAFGAKIVRRRGHPVITSVVVTEPIEGSGADVVEPSQLGGTRHLSAAQFVQDQRDAIALVASQDGRFTAFAWSPCEDMVHAHRIEALLL